MYEDEEVTLLRSRSYLMGMRVAYLYARRAGSRPAMHEIRKHHDDHAAEMNARHPFLRPKMPKLLEVPGMRARHRGSKLFRKVKRK